MVRVVPIDALPATRSLGFLAERGTINADLKTRFAEEIDAMFGAAP